jgi:hypothetical protein
MVSFTACRSLYIFTFLTSVAAFGSRNERQAAFVSREYSISDEEFEHHHPFIGRQRMSSSHPDTVLNCSEEASDTEARFALQYREECESLGHVERAFLKRNRQRYLNSMVLPASVKYERKVGEPLVIIEV